MTESSESTKSQQTEGTLKPESTTNTHLSESSETISSQSPKVFHP
ncbi:MAG: hypothetical protein QNJ64_20480 [Crocosphaera sp.]|nr:hypothetical protein [Crocosphaera sp.]